MRFPPHPFDVVSKSFGLRTLLAIVALVSVACWLATFLVGRVLLGVFATLILMLLAIACWTWLWASIEQELRKPLVDSRDSADDSPVPVESMAGGSASREADAESC